MNEGGMTPDRWQRMKDVLDAAWERSALERSAYLDQACAGDPSMRAEIDSLLASDEEAGDFLAGAAHAHTEAAKLIRAFGAEADCEEMDGDLLGTRLGPYAITGLIGTGGMGAVYRAVREDDFRMEVAVKLLKRGTDTDAALTRFRVERQILAGLQHPNIACLLDGGATASGLPYLVMEYVHGQPLLEYAATLNIRKRLELFRAVCSAVQYAHEHSVVHRDIKPTNILVTEDGAPKLLDFGIAKVVGASEDAARQLTVAGERPMTPAYASPEQVRGEPVTAATDIYSLGAVLYELLTGRRPALNGRGPEPPSAIEPSIHTDLDKIVLMAMRPEPERRYASATNLALDIDRFVRDLPVSARSESRVYRFRKLLARNRVPVVVAAVSICLGLAFPAGLARFARTRAAPVESGHSIAVLPLENVSGGNEGQYFAEGMTDALIETLAQIRDLRVISRTSSMSFKGVKKPLPEIARSLGVQTIAEGTVSRTPERVHLSVRLVDAPADRQIWTGNYEGEPHQILRLQEQVAGAIAERIGVTLAAPHRSQVAPHERVDIAAYDAYLQGRRVYFSSFTEESAKKAIAWFQRALELDGRYAPAYAGIADCYYLMSNIYYPPNEVMPKARAAAHTALQLDDSLGGAHASLALIHSFYEFDRAAAEHEFKRAIELKPSDMLAHLWFGLHLAALGRFDESMSEVELAQKIDPVSISTTTYIAFPMYMARRYVQLIERLQPIADMHPDYHQVHAFLALAYEQQHEWTRAIDEMELAYKLDHEPEALAQLGHIYAGAGRSADARRVLSELKELSRKRYISPYHFAVLHTALGERDEAFRFLEKVEEDRSEWFGNINVDPRLDELHSDPRFARILKIVGLAN